MNVLTHALAFIAGMCAGAIGVAAMWRTLEKDWDADLPGCCRDCNQGRACNCQPPPRTP